jgi:CubicO group peptidase (beta-lactamase class C family)
MSAEPPSPYRTGRRAHLRPASTGPPRRGHAVPTPDQDELEAVVDEAFSDEESPVTNAVVVIQGGRVLIERYGGVKEFFDRPPNP